MFTIKTNIKHNHKKHAYVVKNSLTQEIIFTGVDTLKKIVTLDKINSLPEFDSAPDYEIIVLGAFDQEGHARNAIHYHYGSICPQLNISVGQAGKYIHSRLIYCNETGQCFFTQQEAALYFNISQSNLSKHLKGYPGHKSIKGRTFKWLNHNEGQELQKQGLLIDKNGKKL